MNLVFFTQKLDDDDDLLGFTSEWVRSLSEKVHHLHCVVVSEGRHQRLSENVTVHSLGKERGYGKLRLVWESQRHLRHIFSSSPVDLVFAHMAPVFTVLSYPLAALHDVPIFTWYTHRKVNLSLRIATLLSRHMLTASPNSFALDTDKLKVMGHGIPVRWLKTACGDQPGSEVLAVGRVSPIKNLETFVEAAELLKGEGLSFRIVGDAAVPSDVAYRDKIIRLVKEKGLSEVVRFEGSVPFRTIPGYYRRALCTVSDQSTNFDKVVLESMACGRPPVTSNAQFEPLLEEDASWLLFPEKDARAVAERILRVRDLSPSERATLGRRLQTRVEQEHDLGPLMDRIIDLVSEL